MIVTRAKFGILASAITLSAWIGPAWAADWSRHFDNGTTNDERNVPLINQGIPGVPAGEFSAAVVQVPSAENRSLRLKFAGGGSDGDSGIMLDHDDVFIGAVSAKALLRYSQNPLLNTTPKDSEINAGFILHVQEDFQSYICVMDDRGYLQLQEVRAGLTIEGFPGGSMALDQYYNVEGFFKPDKDWWIRFEVIPLPPEGVHLRARAWEDGTPEPLCTWMVEAFDTVDPLFGGLTALVANEDKNVPDAQNYIDVDDASVSSTLTCVEVCGNGLDDDEDGGADCADLDCDQQPGCACHEPFADVDGDKDVDQLDFAEWQTCFTGTSFAPEAFDVARCDCLDREDADSDGLFHRAVDGDGDIDGADLAAFLLCVSGPSIPANPACAG